MAAVKRFVREHPNITAWLGLSVGFVIMLLFAAKDVDLLPTQLLALVVSCIALAAACVWIINWD